MKKTYITPCSEALTLDSQDFVCASEVPGEIPLSIEGPAIDKGVTDGDSRFLDFTIGF